MNDDPAKHRFLVIQLARLSGLALVILGLLVVRGMIGLPEIAGYVLLAAGMAEILIVPRLLIRRWRSSRP